LMRAPMRAWSPIKGATRLYIMHGVKW
jgi:hypothetical protein